MNDIKNNLKTSTIEREVIQLRKDLSRQQHYLDSVHETALGLTRRYSVDDLLEKILARAGSLAGTPDTFLYLYEPQPDELVIKLGQGAYMGLIGTRLKPSQGLAGKVYSTGKAVLIEDYSKWPKRLDNPLYDTLHSALGIPLKSNTFTIGVVGLGSFNANKPFGPSDVENMSRFAELASVALENARLNADLQKELNERRQAEKSIRILNAELEQRVAERTRKLENVNKALQAATRNAEELAKQADAANQARSAFFTNMSHELRTPLNAIIGFTQIMGRDTAFSATQKEELTIINQSGEHLLSLINDVLDMAKIEAGKILINESRFNLAELLNKLENMFRLKTEEKGLKLLFHLSQNVPFYIKTDERKLSQILINLINNAIKFTHQGSIIVRVGLDQNNVPVQKKSDFIYLKFSVTDTGPGLAISEMDGLFDAFVQTQTGKSSKEGTGLGLPISQKFIKLMKGDITVNSRKGKGSVFEFTIQAKKVSQTESDRLESNTETQFPIGIEPDQPEYRILIVDDLEVNRRLLSKMLAPLGFRLKEADNGKNALEICFSWQPHLIWMDLRMPVMDGYDATRKLKAASTGQTACVIAVTASVLDEDKARIMAAGFDDFLGKPFQHHDILKMLQQHLGVRFLYPSQYQEPTTRRAAETKELDETLLAAQPAAWRNELEQALNNIDLDRIETLFAGLEETLPELAKALTKAIKNYEYEKILHQLQTAKGSS